MPANRQIHLRSRPDGAPSLENFELVTVETPDLAEGQLLIRNHWMSVDPYMRGRMDDRESYVPPFKVGRALNGAAIGEVVDSKHPDYAAGDLVSHMSGWREYAVNDGRYIDKLPADTEKPELFLGLFGTTGLTAWFGLMDVAAVEPGETVFVSAAAGAVGSAACQIAVAKGCNVVGSCGSDQKGAWLRDDMGVEHVINYKASDDLALDLQALAPGGIDVYFDNVGGAHLQAALANMKPFGRVAVCGMIAAYNAAEAGHVDNLFEIIARRVTMKGFLLADFQERFDDALADLGQLYRGGKLTQSQTIFEGIENAPAAFLGLFSGENTGKMLVRLGK